MMVGTPMQSFRQFLRAIVEHRFVKDVGVLTIANLINMFFGLGRAVFVARLLGPESYGVATLVIQYSDLVFAVLSPVSSMAAVKYLSEFRACDEHDRFLAIGKLGYLLNAVVACVAFLVVAGTSSWAALAIIHHPGAEPLIIIYAASHLLGASRCISSSVFVALERFSVVAWLEVLMSLLQTGLVVGLVSLGWRETGVVLGNAVLVASRGLVYAIVAHTSTKRLYGRGWLVGPLRALRGYYREILAFFLYTDLNVLIKELVKRLDTLLVGYVQGPTGAGYYKVAIYAVSVIGYLSTSLESVTYPRFSRLWGLDKLQELKASVKRYALKVGMPLGMLVLVGVPLVPAVIGFLLGEEFLPSSEAVQLLVVGSAIALAFFWLRPFILTLGKVRFLAARPAFLGVLQLIGLIIAVPRWGYIGAAYVRFTAGVLMGHVITLAYVIFLLRDMGSSSATTENGDRAR